MIWCSGFLRDFSICNLRNSKHFRNKLRCFLAEKKSGKENGDPTGYHSSERNRW